MTERHCAATQTRSIAASILLCLNTAVLGAGLAMTTGVVDAAEPTAVLGKETGAPDEVPTEGAVALAAPVSPAAPTPVETPLEVVAPPTSAPPPPPTIPAPPAPVEATPQPGAAAPPSHAAAVSNPPPATTREAPPAATVERIEQLFVAAVPAAWRDAIPTTFRIIPGQTSWAHGEGIIDISEYHAGRDDAHLSAVITHEFGHLVAFRFGSGAYVGAAPEGWPEATSNPAEHWADCVQQVFVSLQRPSHGLPPCGGAQLDWAGQFLAAGPPV